MAEGLFAEIFAACSSGAVLTGWAIYLGADPFLIGVVTALPQLGQLFQIPAAWTTARLGSRRAAIMLVAAQRQVGLPLALLPWLPLPTGVAHAVLVAVTALAAILNVLGNNAWVTWMGDLVPQRIRGRYFGRRTAWCTAGGALASAAAGLLLDGSQRHGLGGEALALLQVLASASGVASAMLMARQHQGQRAAVAERGFFLTGALAPLRDRSMRGFFRYLVAWNVAIGIAGGFFSLFMLGDLRMGFTLVALQSMGTAVVRMLVMPAWGGVIDRVGARPVLVACSFGISLIPVIWLFPTPTCLWPLALDSLLTGLLWSGHSLASFNLPLAVTPRANRPVYLALFATVSGVSSALATAAAGWLLRVLPAHLTVAGLDLHGLQQLFVLSALLRLVASFVALRIEHASTRDVLIVMRAARAALPPRLLRRAWRQAPSSDIGQG